MLTFFERASFNLIYLSTELLNLAVQFKVLQFIQQKSAVVPVR